MSDYTSNMNAVFNGHLGLPTDPPDTKYNPQGRTSLNDTADIRDALAHVVAGGYTDFSNKDVQANYKYIARLVGASRAERLFVQAFSFNQKPGNNKPGGADKIQQFYNTGSSDPETDKTMTAIKNFGGGVKSGFQSSVDEGVKLLNKSDVATGKAKDDKSVATIKSIANKNTDQ
jgi:hypothetical protein